jgi:hypothetical protein
MDARTLSCPSSEYGRAEQLCKKKASLPSVPRRVVLRVLHCTANTAPRNFPIPRSARSRAARSYDFAAPNLVDTFKHSALQPCSNAQGLDPCYCSAMGCIVCLFVGLRPRSQRRNAYCTLVFFLRRFIPQLRFHPRRHRDAAAALPCRLLTALIF